MLDIPSGALSDRIGRERLIAYSMGLAAAAALMLWLFNSLATFLAAAALFGASYGLNWSPLLALIGDGSAQSGRGKAFGRYVRIVALGEGVAPVMVALVVSTYGTRIPFVLVAALSVVCFGLLWNTNQKAAPKRKTNAVHSFRVALNLLCSSVALNLFLVASAFFVAFFWESVWFTEPILGFYSDSVTASALVVATFSVPILLFSDLTGFTIDRIGERRVFLGSAAVAVVSFGVFYASRGFAAQIASVFAASVGVLGIWLVLDVLTARLHAPHERGVFFGLLETVRDVAYLVSPLFVAATYPIIGLDGVFGVDAAAALLLFVWGAWIFKRIAGVT